MRFICVALGGGCKSLRTEIMGINRMRMGTDGNIGYRIG
jgi:hypothetical protein